MKIVIYSVLLQESEIERKIIEDSGFTLLNIPFGDSETFYEEIKTADGIIVADGYINEEQMQSLENCKVIVVCGVGYDNIHIESAKKKGIVVSNVPDYCVDEVADFTIALIFAMARHIPSYDKHIREGIYDIYSIYDKTGFPKMRRLNTQTVSILGLGRIGGSVAKKLNAIGFRVLASDPYVNKNHAKELGAELVDFDTAIEEADYLTINIPLTTDTQAMLNMDIFKKMKKTAFIINTGRGPVINEEDLIKALEDKIIAGAALDVTNEEPLKKDNPLVKLENTILTPHAAFFTEDSFIDLRKKSTEEAVRVLKGELPNNRVNN